MIQLHTLSTLPPKNPFDRLVPSTDLSFMGALTDEEHLENAAGQAQAHKLFMKPTLQLPFPALQFARAALKEGYGRMKAKIVLNRKESLYFIYFR